MEFDKDNIRYIVAIKSGPKWSNSQSLAKLRNDFKRAKIALRTSNSNIQVIAVNGCCYGRSFKPDKGDYFMYCGQQFWQFISGVTDLYKDIVEPLGHKAKQKNDAYHKSYAQVVNRFTREFSSDFCENDVIDWEKIVELNSSMPKKKKKK